MVVCRGGGGVLGLTSPPLPFTARVTACSGGGGGQATHALREENREPLTKKPSVDDKRHSWAGQQALVSKHLIRPCNTHTRTRVRVEHDKQALQRC